MNKIEKLVAQLCPNGVEHVFLESLFNLRKGENLTSEEAVPGSFPVITASRGSTLSHNQFNFSGECITISSHGAYAGYVSYYNEKFWLGNNVFLFESKGSAVSTRFYFHVLKTLAHALLASVRTGGIPYINAKDLTQLLVPYPPIEVQIQIVEILDMFTELDSELESELEARKTQFEFYRDYVLTFRNEEAGSAQLISMGDICLIKTGEGISKELISENPGPYPVINSGRDPLGYFGRFNTENDPLGITSRGAGVGSITWCEGPYFRGNLNYAVSVRDPNFVDTRYLYFWLNAHQREIHKLCTFEAIPALNKANLERLMILVPSLPKQKKLVALLNTFEDLTKSVAAGLPGEIAARRKQYEYYRHKLLTFKRLEVA
jgi:type I restriction enzyme S subunit